MKVANLTVPKDGSVRSQIKKSASALIQETKVIPPVSNAKLNELANNILADLKQPEDVTVFAMVEVINEIYRDQFFSVPFNRRLLLLPHCLRKENGCVGEYNDIELACKDCGKCCLTEIKKKAEALGYTVLIAEGTPIVLKLILSGRIEGVMGISCLKTLEKMFSKISVVGVPGHAIPLIKDGCRDTEVDLESVMKSLTEIKEGNRVKLDYMNIKNRVIEYFDEINVKRVIGASLQNTLPFSSQHTLGETTVKGDFDSVIKGTNKMAIDYIVTGGRRFRPYLLVATYCALKGKINIPDHILKVALAVETLHKASLMHDDIVDNEEYRYGIKTNHEEHSSNIAINVGDYLLGLVYNIISKIAYENSDVNIVPVFQMLTNAHVDLCEGQGAELIWDERKDKEINSKDAIKIYALKTSPLFNVAIKAGCVLAGFENKYDAIIDDFAYNLGIAFQIKNDLKDFTGDIANKKVISRDISALRPTILFALANEVASQKDKEFLLETYSKGKVSVEEVESINKLYKKYSIPKLAQTMCSEFQEKAIASIENIEVEEFKLFLANILGYIFYKESKISNKQKSDQKDIVVAT